ncbi:MAG: Cna domain protein [Acidobacteria bacterium]|nr:Cna domain protein [Acidobacteriota bacterium]
MGRRLIVFCVATVALLWNVSLQAQTAIVGVTGTPSNLLSDRRVADVMTDLEQRDLLPRNFSALDVTATKGGMVIPLRLDSISNLRPPQTMYAGLHAVPERGWVAIRALAAGAPEMEVIAIVSWRIEGQAFPILQIATVVGDTIFDSNDGRITTNNDPDGLRLITPSVFDWSATAFISCALQSLGLTSIGGISDLINNLCSLGDSVNTFWIIFGILKDCTACGAAGILACVYCTADLLNYAACPAAEIASCVNGDATFRVSGRVTEGGSGLSQVVVSAGSRNATTDGSGNFTIDGLSNGGYSVVPNRSGHTFSPPSRSVLVSGSNITGQDFVGTSTSSGCNVQSINSNTSYAGTWSSDCAASHRSGSYARYFSFTLGGSTSVQIDLGSQVDSFLYLLNGSTPSATVITSDDDSGDGTNSRITRTLSAGTYTLEATTYGAGQTGSFSISVISSTASYAISGNVTTSTGGALSQVQVTAGSGSATTDGNGAYSITGLGNGSYSVVPARSGFTFSPASRSVNINGASVSSQNFTVVTSSTGGCSVQAITPNTSVSGNWGTDCASVHRSGKYARFYTFTLSASASVQIDATSNEDTYIYLMNGNSTSGSTIAEDDDSGGGSNSRLTRTLSAGTYTVEVTTYFSGRTGPFVIRVTR